MRRVETQGSGDLGQRGIGPGRLVHRGESTESYSSTSDDQTPPVAPKRPVGRPRKRPVHDGEELPVKRPVGRPRIVDEDKDKDLKRKRRDKKPTWSTRYQTNLEGVCVCNATQCDTVSNDYTSLTTGQVGVYTTSKAGDRFAYKVVNVDSTAVSNPTYSIDVSTQYQTMIGFGGSFTDAAAINVYKLSSTLQQIVLQTLVGKVLV
ncbi:hypothetical protein PHYBOEH_011775 [Phytophthora boehmeriae]|uniref:Uncharacterized protein n=1 Tax=Phytophthora boehmeriae TaxID=109152 RepID=A0A8T1WYT6_9STRA|nr:hypothetical protein PHYBOEH_011775 [Phytophthora boehmeriae]